MAGLISTWSQILDLPPSCIAFNPSKIDLFVVGTYHLHSEDEPKDLSISEKQEDDAKTDETDKSQPSKRSGSIVLCRLNENDEISILATVTAPAAILDLKWSPHEPSLLAIVTSTGQLGFYRLSIDSGVPTLDLESIHQLAEPSTLIFYLSFHPTNPHILALTLSTGSVSLCHPIHPSPNPWSAKTAAAPLTLTELTTHTLEPWILTFLPTPSPTTTNLLILSGADDGILTLTRANPQFENSGDLSFLPEVVFQDRKIHQAGVTFLLPLLDILPPPVAAAAAAALEHEALQTPETGDHVANPESHLVLTGSYDDHIRLLRIPSSSPGRAKVLAEMDLGGGVWRVEKIPRFTSTSSSSSSTTSTTSSVDVEAVLLVSCMYAGTRVVRISRDSDVRGENGDGDEGWEFEVLGKFEEHESMNYGSAVEPVEEGGGRRRGGGTRVVSTSFYDRLMCVWRV